MQSGKLAAEDLRLVLRGTDKGMQLDFAALVNGAKAQASGKFVHEGERLSFNVEDLRLAKADAVLKLDGPGRLEFASGTLTVRKFGVSSSGGHAVVTGKISGRETDLELALNKMPASLANVVAENLGLSGTIDGSLALKGPLDNPTASATLEWRNATAAESRELGLPPSKFH